MELILHADHVLTMNPGNEVIPNGAVLIGRGGRIQRDRRSPCGHQCQPGCGGPNRRELPPLDDGCQSIH